MRSLFLLFTVAVLAADPSEAACTSPFSEVGGRCLQFFSEAELSFTDAELSCDIIGGHLAQVDACELLGEISTFIATSGNAPTTGAYWIGASDAINEGQFVWVNDINQAVPLGVPFWGAYGDNVREPSGGTVENCVALRADDGYHFHDEKCDNLYGALCEENNAQPTTSRTNISDFHGWKVTCPEGYTDVNGKCYLALSDALVSWTEASVTCNFNGGRLAKVDQCDQLGSLSQFLPDTSETSSTFGYRIGFTDENSEGVFQYVDGSFVDLTSVFWGQYEGAPEPNGGTDENCVEMKAIYDYYFNDEPCDCTLAVLCEADAISYVN